MTFINLKHKEKEHNIECKTLKNPFSQAMGLMFQSYKKAKNTAFIFSKERKPQITGMFCFFPILILFLKNKQVIDHKILKPFTLNHEPKQPINSFIEIPLTKKEASNLSEKELVEIISNLPRIKKVVSDGRKV